MEEKHISSTVPSFQTGCNGPGPGNLPLTKRVA